MRRHIHIGVSAPPTLQVAAVGFGATAVAFGPARVGFGLFLPRFREAFALSTNEAGMIASGAFLAFLLALPLTAWLVSRVGPRAPVAAGALSAAAGFGLAAMAQSVGALAAGVGLAGASAGFCWTPFNDATERVAPPDASAEALSAISTGAAVGVAGAAALALCAALESFDWRVAWAAFCLVATAAAAPAILAVPAGARPFPEDADMSALRRSKAAPLYGAGVLFGATNAAYLAFAADRVVAAGGLPGLPEQAAAPVIFVAYGLCGLVGLATGRIEARIGLPALLALIFAAFAASLALVGRAPGSWAAVLASASLHGAGVMMVSATLAFWSLRRFPGLGSIGFTAALVATALGSVVGPAAAGPVLTFLGPADGFLALAGPAAAFALGAAVVSAGRRTGAARGGAAPPRFIRRRSGISARPAVCGRPTHSAGARQPTMPFAASGAGAPSGTKKSGARSAPGSTA